EEGTGNEQLRSQLAREGHWRPRMGCPEQRPWLHLYARCLHGCMQGLQRISCTNGRMVPTQKRGLESGMARDGTANQREGKLPLHWLCRETSWPQALPSRLRHATRD